MVAHIRKDEDRSDTAGARNTNISIGPQTQGRNRDLTNIKTREKLEWPAPTADEDGILHNTLFVVLNSPTAAITTAVGAADNAELLASSEVGNFSDILIHSIAGNASVDFSWSNDGAVWVDAQSAVAAGSVTKVPVIAKYMKILQAAAGTATVHVAGVVRDNANVHALVAVDALSDGAADALLTALDSSTDDNGYIPVPLNQVIHIPHTEPLENGSSSGGRLDMKSSDPLIGLNPWTGGN